jgi:tetratricopeptide (TPR) repeat protein
MSLVHLAFLYAMDGRRDDARRALARNEAEVRDLGSEILLASHCMYAGCTLMLLGDIVDAERILSLGVTILQRLEERYLLSTAAALLAQTVRAQGRTEEALRLIEVSESVTSSDDPVSQMLTRGVRARILADQGDIVEAERLAREATAIGTATDYLNGRGDAHFDLAHVLFAAGRAEEAIEEAQTAQQLYRDKGNVVAADRAGQLVVQFRGAGDRA